MEVHEAVVDSVRPALVHSHRLVSQRAAQSVLVGRRLLLRRVEDAVHLPHVSRSDQISRDVPLRRIEHMAGV